MAIPCFYSLLLRFLLPQSLFHFSFLWSYHYCFSYNIIFPFPFLLFFTFLSLILLLFGFFFFFFWLVCILFSVLFYFVLSVLVQQHTRRDWVEPLSQPAKGKNTTGQKQSRSKYNRRAHINCTRGIPRVSSSGDQGECTTESLRTPTT